MKRIFLTVLLGLCFVFAYGTPTGTLNFCVGASSTLTDATGGGTWSSSNPAVATIGSSSGTVFGVAAGTARISYIQSGGSFTYAVVTVNTLPSVISGASSVCTGSLIFLSNSIGGGSWSSSNTSAATIGSASGYLTGIAAGATIVVYTLPTGCTRSTTITVNQAPAPIAGSNTVCAGSTTNLSDLPAGGTWTSSNSLNAPIGSASGIVSGVAMTTTVIKYTLSTGCFATMPLTVNPLPSIVLGNKNVCIGSLTVLSDITAGGHWTSTATAIATVGSGDGFVTGIAAGTSIISYALNTGCARTAIVTVNPFPASISGATHVCVAATTALSDAMTGGTWSSSNTTYATVNGTSGVVTGVVPGTVTITYKLPTGCITTTSMTVDSLPLPITGVAKVCVGLITNLFDATGGGVWSTTSTGASVDGSGGVSGISAGTAIITYASGTTGCRITKTVTVNPLPLAITGSLLVCAGSATALTDATTGGTWSSNDGGLAFVSGTGLVSGIAAGNPVITYQLATGCNARVTLTVQLTPVPVTGNAAVCAGSVTGLTDATGGGTWSSSNAAVGTVDGSGNVSGIAPGTTTITYALPSGCLTRKTVTVNSLPAVISGASIVCTGASMTLSDTPTGGSWSSSDISIAPVTATGIVSGFITGTVNISYTLGTGCVAVHPVTVNPSPSALSGSLSVCAGSVTALSDAAGGGSWSSSNIAAGTVDGSGNVTGIAAGTTTITYVVANGCRTTSTVAVIALPAGISGPAVFCTGVTATLSDATPSGTWSSSDAATADVSGTGVLIPVSAGTATITYTAGTGCIKTLAVSVNSSPSAITGGAPYVCVGSTTTFSDGTPGGTWVSGAPGLAAIGSLTGIVSGLALGNTVITYKAANGCIATVPLAVHVGPTPIAGLANVCEGAMINLTDGLASGTWSSSDPSVGSIAAISGAVLGISAGTTNITYALSSSCLVTKTITVNPSPAAIAGTLVTCPGIISGLSDAVGGGIWSSGNPAVAGVGSGTGVVTALAAGTTRMTYTLSSCKVFSVITVNPLPYLIGGTRHVCPGLMTSLTDLTPGGTWSSGAPGNAIVGSTGFVTGISAGTNEVTYTLSTGCMRSVVVTVDPLPAPISGSGHVCLGLTTSLTDLPLGGTWTSGASSVANINVSSGVVMGVSAGTAVITYRLSTSCIMTTIFTVDPLPSPISGLTNVCVGLTTPLTEAAGGTWSSGNPAVATIDGGGLVTGVAPGTVTITYTLGTGCIKTTTIIVNPLPLPITGVAEVCAGSVTTLSDATVFGTWSSDNAAVATVNAYGSVTGVSVGTANITYTRPSGCQATKIITVNALPPAILGSAFVCVGSTSSLSDPAGAGTWSSSNTAVATVGSASGIVSGLASGGATITYRQAGTGCRITTPFVVNSLPPAISGPLHVCEGAASTLTDAVAGGTWSSGNSSVALIGLLSGMTNGVAPGTTTISYTAGTGCVRTATLTVNQMPAPILGAASMCSGSSITLSDAVAGGTWSTGDIYIVTTGSTGVVHGTAPGTAVITYSLAGACRTHAIVTVTAMPVAIYGTRSVCEGSYTLLTDPTVGGTWSSSNPAVAEVSLTSGNVAGMAAGTAIITYSIGACFKTAIVTVNPSPGPIQGTTAICVGTVSTLSDMVPGGTWTTGAIGVAPVSPTGVVTAASVGTANITYSLGAGCKVMTTVVVNIGPAAITGNANMCHTGYTPFTDASAGGLWSSSNTSVVSIGFVSGWAHGEATGTATITYSISTGCYVTKTVTVNSMPSIITPAAPEFCNGTSIVLHDSIPGGYWTSANTTVAHAGSLTGVISGIAEGTATITYKLTSGCAATVIVTVDRSPAPIVGPAMVCVGSHIFLSDATVAGVWSVSNGSATIDLLGNVAGIDVGRDTVTYALSNGCKATMVLTVNTYAAPIAGDTHVCTSSTTTLSDATPGGFWTSSDPSLAAIGSLTGLVTGIAAGTVTISYQIPGGCMSFMLMTIDQGPGVIQGTMYFCEGNTVTLTDSVSGGIWSSSTPSVAFAAPLTGVITGAGGGTATISYRLSEGCAATAVVTVSPIANAGIISGYHAVCLGSSINMHTTGQAGIWHHNNPYIIRLDSVSGLVTSLSTGLDTVFYTVAQLCTVDTSWWQLTVGPEVVINSITGKDNVCLYGADSLHNETPGGNWFSSNPAIGTISADGVLSALSPGLDTISYVVYSTCAAVKRKSVIVDELPSHPGLVINPGGSVCSNSQYMNIGAGTPQTDGFLYTWDAVNANIYAIGTNKQNSLVTFPTSGTAIVVLTKQLVITGCAVTDSFVTSVGSSSSPNASVQYAAPEFTCTDGSADSYQWGYDAAGTLDSTLIPGATSQTYTQPAPAFNSRFYWVMTSHGGCIQKAYYNVPPAVMVNNAVVGNFEFKLFPNPATRQLNIEVKGLNSNDDITVKLFDMLGRETEGCSLVSGKGEINVTDLSQGVYSVILVKDGMKIGARTFVKN